MWYVLQRVGYAVLVIFLASLVTFAALRVAPGDAITSMLNPTTTPPDVIAQYRQSLGLDLPLWEQYLMYARGLLTGDFGISLTDRQPVMDIVLNGAVATITLALAAFIVAFGIGVPAGVLAALHRDSLFDRIVRGIGSFFNSVPNFVLALILVLVFAVQLRWLPVSGIGSWKNVILPTLVLAADPCALTMRVTRTSVIEQANADFTRTLRARGIPGGRVNWVHVLRNSLNSVVSLGAVQIRTLLGYTLIVEVIFRWPGLGSQLVQSILNRDYPVASALALLLAVVVVIASALGDLALRWVDPRIRVSSGGSA
ncbi:MAG: ABC transporter permease [Actinomycetales bacterium]|nr:ABC transporter permease [Actinomycetales bacterium]